MLEIVTGWLPVFVSVASCGWLVVPISCVEKVKVDGVKVTV